VTKQLHTAPRMIEIYEQGCEFDHQRWDGKLGHCIRIELADGDVQAMTHGALRSLPLPTQHEVFDERISRLSLELADEALRGRPTGDLYVQGLCVALLGVLASRGGADGPTRGRTLSAAQKRKLAERIAHDLGGKLSLSCLAHEVGLSPHHFARLFKATYGTTPHQYVQTLRIEAAAAALRRDRATSIAEIALAHGFASQSHMTALLHRHLGLTPRALRRDDKARF
jgi:AraC family transcriptional regulator